MLGRHHHEDQLLHYGHALARAQAVNPFDRARDRLQARADAERFPAALRGEAPPAAVETLGAQAAPRAGGAPPGDPGDDCPCARCCARRIAEAATRVRELACRIVERAGALEPSSPPPPAPFDADVHARPAGAGVHRR
jgi:hypothetical protein